MSNKIQKFHTGDIVRVRKYAPWVVRGSRSVAYMPGHGKEAKVVGSYRDQYGFGDRHTYVLRFKRGGNAAWYDEKILELVRRAPEW